MILINRQEKAAGVAARWHEVYFKDNDWYRYGGDKELIYKELVALGTSPTADDVDKAIGNPSWTSQYCTNCDQISENLILIGKVDYDTDSAYLCKPCCETSLKMFETALKMLSGEEK